MLNKKSLEETLGGVRYQNACMYHRKLADTLKQS